MQKLPHKDVPKFKDIHSLLIYANEHQASDLHLSAGMPAIMRINGDMIKVNMPIMDNIEVNEFILSTLTKQQQAEFKSKLELDYAVSIKGLARYRINAFTQSRGVAAVFRIIPATIPSLQQLKLDEYEVDKTSVISSEMKQPTLLSTFQRIANFNQGLVLVTGPTGSGKSTTVAAMVDYINSSKPAHIITIEDPIEFVHASKLSLINQREVMQHTLDFTTALRSTLREDPDVIVIGELRDLNSIRLALTAAETGHLVFATLHTNSAIKTIDRIIDVFPATEKEMVRAMLSESLQAVISQILVKRSAGGRIAAHELMLLTPAIRNLIRQNKLSQIYSAMQTGGSIGMRTLNHSLNKLLQQNLIEPECLQGYENSSQPN